MGKLLISIGFVGWLILFMFGGQIVYANQINTKGDHTGPNSAKPISMQNVNNKAYKKIGKCFFRLFFFGVADLCHNI